MSGTVQTGSGHLAAHACSYLRGQLPPGSSRLLPCRDVDSALPHLLSFQEKMEF